MAHDRLLRFFLDPDLHAAATSGGHNFLNRLASVLQDGGYQLEYHLDDDNGLRLAHRDDGAYNLFHMRHPIGPRALVFRRVYQYPFWAIEPSAERWHWRVAKTAFNPERIDPDEAARFTRFWRKKLFDRAQPCPKGEGFLYIPMQRRLTEHRSFQSCAPVDMVEKVLNLDPRPVVAAMAPKKSYDANDHAALTALAERYPQLTVTIGGMEKYLSTCDAVITQNSAVAFNGYFLEKPAVLFAEIDFHHIALDARRDPAAALAALGTHAPDYEKYLYWFWQVMSINAGKPTANDAIRDAILRAGWPLD